MSQRRSDLHTSTNFSIYIFPPNLYSNRLHDWKCKNSHWPPYYFGILTISESFDTVAFVRILWCPCRVSKLDRTWWVAQSNTILTLGNGFKKMLEQTWSGMAGEDMDPQTALILYTYVQHNSLINHRTPTLVPLNFLPAKTHRQRY